MIYETYQIKKPIRLIELFAGYGSQSLALKYLGVQFEHWCICEWATKSIQAYNDLHIRDYKDYSKELTQEEVINKLFTYGISMNYNKPMTYEQIKRKGDKWQRKTYNNIIATHNLVNIQNAKAKDLNIIDTNKYDYILTYSFPCQDLSLAGKGKGMSRDSGTRSGMLWEVERLLKECEELPQILVMENVPQVHGKGNIEHFREWIMQLEKLGYTSFYDDLNSKNFYIPQNRERTFMISILGKYNYKMPKTMKLKYRLKNILEKEVSKKYYLSDKMIKYISANNEKWTGNNNGAFINKSVASTLNTGEGSRRCDASNYVADDLPDNFNLQNTDKIMVVGKSKSGGQKSLILDEKGICNCLSATDYKQPKQILIKEATKKGYSEAYEGDGVYIDRPYQKRGVVQHGMIQTLKTSPDVGVVVKIGNYSPSGHNAASIVDSEGIAPTVMENHGTVTATVINDKIKPKLVGGIGNKKLNGGTQYYQQDRVYDGNGIAMCHPANLPSGSYMYLFDDKESNEEPKINIVEIPQIVKVRKYPVDTNKLSNVLKQAKANSGWNNKSLSEKMGLPLTTIEHWFRSDNFFSIPPAEVWYDLKQLLNINTNEFDKAIMTFEEKEGVFEKSERHYLSDGLMPTLTTQTKNEKIIENNLRIRKLTPKECFRLMGVKNEDFKNIHKNQSQSSLYHLAGDSIVTTVLMAIFGELLDIDYKTKINDLVNNIVNNAS